MIRLRHLLLLTTALVAFAPLPAAAGPEGGVVVNGAAQISNPSAGNTTVNQFSDKAIINWRLFDIGASERVQFVQPNSSSIILNRVTGGLGASQIMGTLDANGRVFIINRDGILFGPNSQVNTAGFLATTHDIRNEDFMAGRFQFNTPGRPDASIVNMGTITASSGGFAALVAPGVRNSGIISATLGSVGLASANGFSLDFYGDRLVTVGLTDSVASSVRDVATGLPLKSLVTNDGKIKANGGRVELTAVAARQVVDSVINTTGVIEANSVGTKNGMIVLGAATAAPPTQAGAALPKQTVKISGTLSASGKRKGTRGGTIVVTGENIEVANATIKATGREGGGTVLIGGDWGGGRPTVAVDNPSARMENFAVPTASTVRVDASSKIDASATSRGNGGKVILWSDEKTTFLGTILAMGGTRYGDGGFVETSGKQHLVFAGSVDTGAPKGKAGTLLLDPADYYIVATLGSSPTGADEMTNTQLQTLLATQNVIIATNNTASPSGQNGDIFVNAPVSWNYSGTSGSLTLSAYRDININESITHSGYNGITLRADSTGTGVGTVNFAAGKVASTYVGAELFYNPTSFPTASNYTSFLPYSGRAYMLVNTVTDLQNVQTNLSAYYALGRDIDASATASWNSGAGFAPIGNIAAPFTGKFKGLDQSISNLWINRPTTDYVGLFGYVSGGSALLSNIHLTNAYVVGRNYVGPLAGASDAPTSFSSATGFATGAEGVGGLMGWNLGSISTSYATTSVGISGTGTGNYVGGLVGINYGAVGQSWAGGDVIGMGSVGGLVGHNSATANVTYSYALGSVTGLPGGSEIGGLIGHNLGGVNNAYATGFVDGGSNTGGLIGNNAGTVTNSFWDNQTSGQATATGTGSLSGMTGLTTAQSRQQSSYTGWDFANNWYMVDNQLRPMLRAERSTTIGNAHQLQLIELAPNDSYRIIRDLTFATTYNPSDIWAPTGFRPISTSFGGVLDGQNHFITNLLIAPTAGFGNVGLFGEIGANGNVRNLNIVGATVTAGSGTQFIGVLAGQNAGTISNVIIANATLSNGPVASGLIAGGLVGQNQISGTINQSVVQVDVTVGNATSSSSENNAGGLVGVNLGTINGSSAAGDVTGGANSLLGGLAGRNDGGTITSGAAIGDVTMTATDAFGTAIGGLVGFNSGTITSGVAVGNVSTNAGGFAGGIAGQNEGSIVGAVYGTGIISGSGTSSNTVALGGIVGSNTSLGTITSSYSSGTVNLGSYGSAGGTAGYNAGAIALSWSDTAVTASGPGAFIGGLVGNNSGTITDSSAAGIVASSFDALTIGDQPTVAGGLVGVNFGQIIGTTVPTAVTPCFAGFSCAAGDVTVGRSGVAGGLVGQNSGAITNSFAIGTVTGGAGTDDILSTVLGGLAGINTGTISGSHARGDVGGPVDWLIVGGLVGGNNGAISDSFASGNVTGGDNSNAGGLVGQTGFCPTCTSAALSNVSASGNVTVGRFSIAGGLIGITGDDDTVANATATGNVAGGSDSFLGGLVGSLGATSLLNSQASGSVTATGPNSILGGLVGASFGEIQNGTSSGAVNGTSESYLGGLVGFNAGTIKDSQTSSTVTGSGEHNFAGGLTGLNFGFIDPTQSSGNVSSGPNSVVGGFVGANGAISFPDGTQFVGTVAPDSGATGQASGGAGSIVGAQVGQTYPVAGTPALPAGSCDFTSGFCGGTLFNPNPVVNPNPPPTPTPIPNEPIVTPTPNPNPTPGNDQDNRVTSPQLAVTNQLIKEPDLKTPDNPITTTTTATNTAPPPSGAPGPRPGGQQTGNPATRSWFGPEARLGTGLPPVTETRFVSNEVVLQLGNGSSEQVNEIARRLGLEVIASESVGLLGRTIYRFRITGGMSVRDVIRALEANKFVAQAQPSYVFQLSQQTPAGDEAPPRGDAGQYIVGKLRLADVHALATGKNVRVAVIDSAIDVNHPDLAGVIAERFDAVGGAETPHAHGTGMAGAIASHRRLLGIAPNARILAIQAFGTGAGSAQGTSLAIVKGLNWAVEQGARIINMSFAGPKDPILEQAIKGLRERGIILIAAAGNAGPKSPPLFPGADSNVIAVSATDADDNVYKNANRGKYIAVAAPGVDILVPAPEGGYQLTTGTSVAAAHISGVAALLLERNPNLKPDELRKILTSSATKLKAKPEDVGAGLVDPYNALMKVAPKTAGR